MGGIGCDVVIVLLSGETGELSGQSQPVFVLAAVCFLHADVASGGSIAIVRHGGGFLLLFF